MALIGLVYQIKPFSSLSLAKIMSLAVIPVFLISPVAGVYVDRWNKRKTMYWSDFLRGIFIVLIPIFFFRWHSLFFVYCFIFLSFCVGRFFIPAKMAIVPSLVEGKDIFLANSLISTTAMIAAMLGLGLGGIIVERWGLNIAFIVDALTFFLSGLCICFMKIGERSTFKAFDLINLSKDAIKTVKRSFVSEIKEGVHYLFNSRETRYASKIFFTLFSFIGSLYVVFVVFIQNVLSTVTLDLGILAVACGFGLFSGTLIYGRFGHKMRAEKTINIAMIFSGLYLMFFAFMLKSYPSKIFAFFSCFVLGVIVAPIVVGVNSLIHKGSDNNLWGRIFSSLEVVIHLAFIIFMFISSYLAEYFGPLRVIVGISVVVVVISFSNLLVKNDQY